MNKVRTNKFHYVRVTAKLILVRMRKILLGLAMGLFLLPQVSFAAEIQMNENYVLEKNTVINDNLLLTGGEAYLNGQVHGDVIAAGGEIHVHGKVSGDFIAAGGTIYIHNDGSIGRNLRLAGGQIVIEGTIAQDVMIYAGDVQILGNVGGNAKITAGTVLLNSAVNGSVKIESDKITLGSMAHISGDFKHSATSQPTLNAGAKIDGTTSILPTSETPSNPYLQSSLWLELAVHTIGYWLIALLLLSLFPRIVQKQAMGVPQNFWKDMGIGLVAIVASLIATAIIGITIIGLPLAILLLLGTLVLIYLSQIPFAFYLTQKISKASFDKDHNRLLIAGYLLFSIAFITLIGLLPFIGGLFQVAISLTGIGAVIREKRLLYRQLQQKELI